MSEGYSSWQQDVVIPGGRGRLGAGGKGGGQEMLLALWRASLALREASSPCLMLRCLWLSRKPLSEGPHETGPAATQLSCQLASQVSLVE